MLPSHSGQKQELPGGCGLGHISGGSTDSADADYRSELAATSFQSQLSHQRLLPFQHLDVGDRVLVVDGHEQDVIRETDFVFDESSLEENSDFIANLVHSRRLLNVLKSTNSADEAWDAYCTLLALPGRAELEVPLQLKRRLSRLIGDVKPKTRTHFLRLLSVASSIHRSGEQLTVHEWNKLIHAAASGMRKKSQDDFRLAFEVYKDMVEGRAPGSRLGGGTTANFDGNGATTQPGVKPDAVTYNILLSIAVRTGDTRVLQRATSLFQESGFPPNRVAHLSMLEFFRQTKQLTGVRSTLLKMRQQGLELGLDGLQTCIWVFGHLECSRAAFMIYRVLRHNVIPDTSVDEEGLDIDGAIKYLDESENIVIPREVLPNESLYTVALQAVASNGDFSSATRIFLDYLSSAQSCDGVPVDEGRGHCPLSMIFFRAFFHAFSRHGTPKSKNPNLETSLGWNEENLQLFFDSFTKLSPDSKPSASTIFWIMNSFNKVTRGDKEKLREVWSRLEDAFGTPQVSGNNRLQRIRKSLLGVISEENHKPS